MEDLGAPISYVVLEKGVPVYSSDGAKVGEVHEIRADMQNDIFDGVVVTPDALLPINKRFVPADEIGEIHERGVLLKLDSTACERLEEV
jgi:uncharacterized protein YrrD